MMTDNEITEKVLSNLFGGKKIELSYNNYRINMRFYEENNSAALNLYRDNYKIYHIDKKFILDVWGELSSWIEMNELNSKPILDILWKEFFE
jgi:hypothetical protein